VASFRGLSKLKSRLLVLALLTLISARAVQTARSVASCILTAIRIVGHVFEVQPLCGVQTPVNRVVWSRARESRKAVHTEKSGH